MILFLKSTSLYKYPYKHGHVVPNTDGSIARCGGPSSCATCEKELADLNSANESMPEHSLPPPGQPDRPTPAQALAGNYKKPTRDWHGLTLAIEQPEGTVREGIDETGKPWRTVFKHAYGEIRNTEGMDGDPVDVFIGQYPGASEVYIIQQMTRKNWSVPDEQKVMIEFGSIDEAEHAYLAHYDDPRFFGGITAMPIEEFIEKVKATKKNPGMIKSFLAKIPVFFKALFSMPVHIAKHERKDGTSVDAHMSTRKKDVKSSIASSTDETNALEAFIEKHGGPEHLHDSLLEMTAEQRAKLIDAMAELGSCSVADVMKTLGMLEPKKSHLTSNSL